MGGYATNKKTGVENRRSKVDRKSLIPAVTSSFRRNPIPS